MWIGEAGVPWWVGDAREIERWGRIVPMYDGHRELALLIIERRLHRLRTPALQSAGRRTFLAAVRAIAPSALEGVRALLHRQRRVVEVEAKWGRPVGWKTGHLVAAGHVPKARVRALAERHQPPTIAELIRQMKPS